MGTRRAEGQFSKKGDYGVAYPDKKSRNWEGE